MTSLLVSWEGETQSLESVLSQITAPGEERAPRGEGFFSTNADWGFFRVCRNSASQLSFGDRHGRSLKTANHSGNTTNTRNVSVGSHWTDSICFIQHVNKIYSQIKTVRFRNLLNLKINIFFCIHHLFIARLSFPTAAYDSWSRMWSHTCYYVNVGLHKNNNWQGFIEFWIVQHLSEATVFSNSSIQVCTSASQYFISLQKKWHQCASMPTVHLSAVIL